jgi:16S rRNA (cytosine967-C5)-methyltransferase
MDSIRSAIAPDALAALSAHPEWLIQRWISQFGIDTARNICSYDQTIPVTALRPRSASVEAELRDAGVKLEPGAVLADSRRVLSGDITKTSAFLEGRIAIQDEASQLVAALVGKGERILDCCAAPGGKTWAIADHNPNASIMAVELHSRRAKILRKRVAAENVHVVNTDMARWPAIPRSSGD